MVEWTQRGTPALLFGVVTGCGRCAAGVAAGARGGGGICRNQPGEPSVAGPLVGWAITVEAETSAATVNNAMRMKPPPIFVCAKYARARRRRNGRNAENSRRA